MRVRVLLVIAFALCLSWSTIAQQEVAESVADEVVDQQGEPVPEDAVQDSEPVPSSVVGGFEDFDPSEDISEDLSVPFPVDI